MGRPCNYGRGGPSTATDLGPGGTNCGTADINANTPVYVTVVRHRVSQLFTLLCVYMYSIVIITFPGIGVYCMSASVALLTELSL